MEIEAIDRTGAISSDELLRPPQSYMQELGIRHAGLEAGSYSDLLADAGEGR